MAFGTNAAKSATNMATSTATGYGSEASDIGSMLVPTLEREATNPTGYNPADVNAMLVAGEGAAGGATGSLSGEAIQRGARSRNNAAVGGTLDELAREKLRANSQNALNVQASNARLKESQRQQGLSGLEKVRGGDISAQLAAEKIVPEDINAWSGARKAEHETGLFSDVLNTIGVLGGTAKKGPLSFV